MKRMTRRAANMVDFMRWLRVSIAEDRAGSVFWFKGTAIHFDETMTKELLKIIEAHVKSQVSHTG